MQVLHSWRKYQQVEDKHPKLIGEVDVNDTHCAHRIVDWVKDKDPQPNDIVYEDGEFYVLGRNYTDAIAQSAKAEQAKEAYDRVRAAARLASEQAARADAKLGEARNTSANGSGGPSAASVSRSDVGVQIGTGKGVFSDISFRTYLDLVGDPGSVYERRYQIRSAGIVYELDVDFVAFTYDWLVFFHKGKTQLAIREGDIKSLFVIK